MKKGLRAKVIDLRKKGYSLNEIAKNLAVAKSTTSGWLRGIPLNARAKERLKERSRNGRRKALETRKKQKSLTIETLRKLKLEELRLLKRTQLFDKLLCSFLYWCEGEKNEWSLRFANSDPELVVTYLNLLRSGFAIDEGKLRACLHLHEYHSEKKLKNFWSKITRIPEKQFLKIYRKPNTGKRKRQRYPGCISVRYNDVKIMREMRIIWEVFSQNIMGE